MEFVKFIFSNFWTFIGFFLVICVIATVIKYLFDFIVELIHGKPTIQNITVPEGAKVITTKDKEADNKIESEVKVEVGNVDVRSN